MERVGGNRGAILLHADAGRVDEDVGVGDEGGQAVEAVSGDVASGGRHDVVGQVECPRLGAVRDVDVQAGVSERERGGATCATGTDHDGRPGEVDTVVFEGPDDAGRVGVVAGRRIGPEVDRVDRADGGREVRRRDRANDVLLEGDGDVESPDAEGRGGVHGRRTLVRGRFEGDVASVEPERIVRGLVHRWRERVADRIADEPVDVHTRRCGAWTITATLPPVTVGPRRSASAASPQSQDIPTGVETLEVVSSGLRHPLVALAVAVALTLPWVVVWALGLDLGLLGTVAGSGVAILGTSFLLAWAAETAEKDVPRSFAIAVLAVLAVAPEYAVDALYAWGAGSKGATEAACAEVSPALVERVVALPRGQVDTAQELLALGCHEGNLAVANMTGANRILIGIGWAGIAFFTVWQARRTRDPAVESRPGWLANQIHLDRDISTEMAFLFLATMWAFLVPLGGGIGVVDLLVLVGLYVAYILIVIRGELDSDTHHVGVPAYLQAQPRPRRIATVLGLFAFSGFLIMTAVEPFAHGLEDVGLSLGIPSFFMIQWVAPLASESPELIVVAVLVTKGRSTAGFNTLISSKLNQWTLLIGTLVVVYSLALGRYGVLPFELEQAGEIWITAAQSYFALALLVNFRLSVREALVLFVLFVSQVAIEFVFLRIWEPFPEPKFALLMSYTAIYLVLGTALFVKRRRHLKHVLALAAFAARRAAGRDATRPTLPD